MPSCTAWVKASSKSPVWDFKNNLLGGFEVGRDRDSRHQHSGDPEPSQDREPGGLIPEVQPGDRGSRLRPKVGAPRPPGKSRQRLLQEHSGPRSRALRRGRAHQ